MRTRCCLGFAGTLLLLGCSSQQPDQVLVRGGRWVTTGKVVDVEAPGMSAVDKQKLVTAMQRLASYEGSAPECRVDKTAATWPKAGDISNATDPTATRCRYLRVEKPGSAIDRLERCSGPDGTPKAIIRTTGTISPERYEFRIETRAATGSAGNVVVEHGERVGDCTSSVR